jgi:hypothetical protein
MPTRLSLEFWEMQGDLDDMQGGGNQNPAKSCQISRLWMDFSLLQEQGGYLSEQGGGCLEKQGNLQGILRNLALRSNFCGYSASEFK